MKRKNGKKKTSLFVKYILDEDFQKKILTNKSAFEKKYPLFVKYILDEDVRKNMLNNADLLRKYDAYSETISIFLFELEKHFDNITINRIITDAILKNPDEIMVSIITSYLNSNETAKSNPEFVLFYNRTSNLGVDSVEYIEENGLITNRTYKDIPNIAIDHKYNELKRGDEEFNGVALDSVYETLTYPQRKFVNNLLENGIYYSLNKIFERFDFSLKTLIVILMNSGIDVTIINLEMYNKIGAKQLMILIYTLIDMDNNEKLLANVRFAVMNRRYDLLKHVINSGLLENFVALAENEMNDLTDTSILKMLADESYALSKKED